MCEDNVSRWLDEIKNIVRIETMLYIKNVGYDKFVYDDFYGSIDWKLVWASNDGDLNKVIVLLEHGANIHADDDKALRLAAENGHLEVVEHLVEHGANVHAKNNEALIGAASNDHWKLVKFLLEKGADVNADDNWALRYAAIKANLEVVEFLIEKGAPIAVAKERGTYAVQEFCKAYELKRKIEEQLQQPSDAIPKSKVFKI